MLDLEKWLDEKGFYGHQKSNVLSNVKELAEKVWRARGGGQSTEKQISEDQDVAARIFLGAEQGDKKSIERRVNLWTKPK